MKKLIILVLATSINFSLFGQESGLPLAKQEAVKALFKKYTDMGIPGLAMGIYNPKTGYWSYAEGFANKEDMVALTTQHVFYLQSVSKTYMAVLILKLYEDGKLSLNTPITSFVNSPWMSTIDGIEKVTVKMLLNHTSGLPEYSTDPILVSRIIQDPLSVLSVEDMLSYIADKPLEFAPGTKYTYRNTNYALLSLIADKLTGDHVTFMNNAILKKLGLSTTYYLNSKNYQSNINLVDAYWDLLLEGVPVNISRLQRANVASMKGDDGLVASLKDAVFFLKGLVTGQLLTPETLKMMQEWVTNEEGERKYGLGLTYYDLDVTYGIGHSGGGVGSGCLLLYLPELESIIFVATNFNTMMESPIRKKAENLQIDILSTLFME